MIVNIKFRKTQTRFELGRLSDLEITLEPKKNKVTPTMLSNIIYNNGFLIIESVDIKGRYVYYRNRRNKLCKEILNRTINLNDKLFITIADTVCEAITFPYLIEVEDRVVKGIITEVGHGFKVDLKEITIDIDKYLTRLMIFPSDSNRKCYIRIFFKCLFKYIRNLLCGEESTIDAWDCYFIEDDKKMKELLKRYPYLE